MTELKNELKTLIIDTLELEDITHNDIIDTDPLFVDGLGLDSIDALELGLAVKKKFDIVLNAIDEATKYHFYCIDSL
ncbi:MAG: phosphopantetheine-binding protein, partial [Psychrosphaera sp.]|nr:phosphopantetheine-binding protein [Psychrosphaera sp.]